MKPRAASGGAPRVVALALMMVAATGIAEALFSAEGYRIARYRAPTPPSVPGGTAIDTKTLKRLMTSDRAVLVDVQAVVVRPEIKEFGMSWLPDQDRLHIPGSTWLPNVGYGRLDGRMARYFQENLARLTSGDRGRAIVIYCVLDCWMSWNAVRRAVSFGYTRVYWYPGGTDAWAEAGGALVAAQPEPIAGASP